MFINKDHELAYKYMQEHVYDKAIQLYSKCIINHPDAASLYSERGVAFIHLNEKDKSLADLNKSVELEPEYAYRYASRGHAKDFFGDIDGAIDDYEIAAEMDPNDPIVYNNLGLLLEKKGNMHKAKNYFKRSDDLRKQEENLQNILEEPIGKPMDDALIIANSNEEEVEKTEEVVEKKIIPEVEETAEEAQSKTKEIKKIFTKKSQWQEFIRFVKNGFKIK